MKEIINQLLEAEKRAKEIVDTAKAEADRISKESNRQVTDLKDTILKQAQEDDKQLIELTTQRVTQEKEALLKESEDNICASFTAKTKQVPSLVQEIMQSLSTVDI